LELQEDVRRAEQRLAGVRRGLTVGEQKALELMLEGERKTTVFAQALGIDHLPKEMQEDQVQRVKDKLKKRIERGRHG
jgi:hypothetical protein